MALLTKQAWRLINQPDTLLARVLKARYYPRSSFFLAEVGERPSLTWRSIIQSRPWLEAGIRRRIGNGATTSIWGDPWLHSSGSGRILTPRPIHSTFPEVVGDIIDWDMGTWNVDRLNENFWSIDIALITQVPVGSPNSNDAPYWFFSPNGRFTVRSCYYNILNVKGGTAISTSGASSAMSHSDWKWLWSLQLPPKVRTFLWRASNDILPVKVNLMRRRMGSDPFCPFCKTELEYTAHLFFECEVFKDLWRASPFNFSLPVQVTNFSNWLHFVRTRTDSKGATLASVICWRIWYLRNQLVHGAMDGFGVDVVE